MSLRPNEVLIHSGNAHEFINPVVEGEKKMHGLIPRDWGRHPCGSIPGAPAATTPKIPRSEWPAVIKELTDRKALLSDVRMTAGPNGGMIPSRDQNGRGYCATEDTEILTEKGWIPYPDYNFSDLAATMNVATGMMEFQKPFASHVYEYDGEMIYCTNRRLDFGVTPDHRMLLSKWDESKRTLSDEFSFHRADNIGWYCGVPHAPSGFIGTELRRVAVEGDREYEGDDFLSLLSLVCSDGYAGGSESTRNWVSFCCFRADRQQKVRELAVRIGFRESPGKPGVWIRYDAGALSEWIRANCYVQAPHRSQNKRLPEIVRVASMRQIKLFLDFFGDQDHGEGSGGKFYSTSKRMIDDLQELHLRIGLRGTLRSREERTSTLKNGKEIHSKGCYELTISTTDRLCIDRKKHIEKDRYKGLVYCASVPNGTLITRRNGSVLISGNCWAHSTVSAAILSRAAANQPYADLSAFAIACIIKNYRDEGGWNGESMQFLRERGCPTSKTWPQQSTNRSNDNPNTWAEAAQFKDTEWEDVPDRDFDQLMTFLMMGIPAPIDLNWWSHSVAACDPVNGTSDQSRMNTRTASGKLASLQEFDAIWETSVGGGFGVRIWNSWSNNWSDNGMGVLTESKATPDGSIALRVMRAA